MSPSPDPDPHALIWCSHQSWCLHTLGLELTVVADSDSIIVPPLLGRPGLAILVYVNLLRQTRSTGLFSDMTPAFHWLASADHNDEVSWQVRGRPPALHEEQVVLTQDTSLSGNRASKVPLHESADSGVLGRALKVQLPLITLCT